MDLDQTQALDDLGEYGSDSEETGKSPSKNVVSF